MELPRLLQAALELRAKNSLSKLFLPTPPENMSELSPGAQAVWTAAWEECPIQCGDIVATRRRQITAALRAAADQVVPPTAELEFYDRNPSPVLAKAIEIRTGLLVIAAELEAQP